MQNTHNKGHSRHASHHSFQNATFNSLSLSPSPYKSIFQEFETRLANISATAPRHLNEIYEKDGGESPRLERHRTSVEPRLHEIGEPEVLEQSWEDLQRKFNVEATPEVPSPVSSRSEIRSEQLFSSVSHKLSPPTPFNSMPSPAPTHRSSFPRTPKYDSTPSPVSTHQPSTRSPLSQSFTRTQKRHDATPRANSPSTFRRLEDYKKQISTLERELRETRENLNALRLQESSVVDLEHKLRMEASLRRNAESDYRKIEAQAHQERMHYQQTIDTLREQNTILDLELTSATSAVLDEEYRRTRDNATQEEKYDQLHAQVVTLRQMVNLSGSGAVGDALMEELEKVREENEQLKKENAQRASELEAARGELSRRAERDATHQQTAETLRAHLASSQAQLESSKTARNALQQELMEVRDECDRTAFTLQEAHATLAEYETELSALQKHIESLHSTPTEVENMQQQLQEVQRALQERDAALSEAQISEHTAQEQIAALQNQLTELQSTLDACNADNAAQATEIATLCAQESEMKHELQTLREHKQHLDELTASQKATLERLQATNSQLQSKLKSSEEGLAAAHDTITELTNVTNSQIHDFEDRIMRFTEDNMEKHREMTRLTEELFDAKRDLGRMEEALREARQSSERARSSDEEQLRQENESLDAQNTKLLVQVRRFEMDMHAMEEERDSLCAEKKQLAATIEAHNATISELRTHNEKLEEELNTATEKLNNTETDSTTLAEQLAEVTSQRDELQHNIADLKERTSQLEAEREALHTCIDSLKVKSDALEQSEKVLKEESSTLQTQISSLEEKKAKILQKLASAQKSLRDANAALQNLQGSQENTASDLQAKLNKMTSLSLEKQKEINALNSTLAQVQRDLETNQKSLEMERDNSSQLKAQYDQIVATFTDTQSELAQHVMLVSTLTTELRESQNALSDDNTQQSQLEELESEKAQLQGQISTLQEAITEHESKVSQIQSDWENRVAELEKSLAEAISQHETISHELYQLCQEKESTEYARREELDAMDSLRSTLEQKELELTASVENAHTMVLEVETLQNELQNVKIQLAEHAELRKQMETDIATLQKEYAQLESTKSALEAQVVELTDTIEVLQTKSANNLLEQREAFENELRVVNDTLKAKEHAHSEALIQLENQFQVQLAAEKESLHVQLQEQRVELEKNASTQSDMSELHASLESLKKVLESNEDTLQQIAAENERLVGETHAKSELVAHLTSQLENKDEETRSLQLRVEAAEKDVQSLNDQTMDLQNTLTELQSEKDTSAAEATTLQEKLQSVESKLQNATAESASLQEKLYATEQELNTQIQQLQTERTDLMDKIASLEQSLATLQSDNNTLRAQSSELETQSTTLLELEEKVASLTASLQNVEKARTSESDSHATTLQQLQHEIATLKLDLESERNQTAEAQVQSHSLQQLLDAAQASLADATQRAQTAEADLSECKKEVDTLRQEKDDAQISVDSQLVQIQTQLAAELAERANVEKQLLYLQAHVSTLQENIAASQVEGHIKSRQISSLEEQLQEVNVSFANAQNQLNSTNALLAGKDAEASKLQERIHAMEDQLAKLNAIENELHDTNSQLEAERQSSTALQNQITLLCEEKDKLMKQLHQATTEEKKHEEELKSQLVEQEHARLDGERIEKSQREKATAELKAALQHALGEKTVQQYRDSKLLDQARELGLMELVQNVESLLKKQDEAREEKKSVLTSPERRKLVEYVKKWVSILPPSELEQLHNDWKDFAKMHLVTAMKKAISSRNVDRLQKQLKVHEKRLQDNTFAADDSTLVELVRQARSIIEDAAKTENAESATSVLTSPKAPKGEPPLKSSITLDDSDAHSTMSTNSAESSRTRRSSRRVLPSKVHNEKTNPTLEQLDMCVQQLLRKGTKGELPTPQDKPKHFEVSKLDAKCVSMIRLLFTVLSTENASPWKIFSATTHVKGAQEKFRNMEIFATLTADKDEFSLSVLWIYFLLHEHQLRKALLQLMDDTNSLSKAYGAKPNNNILSDPVNQADLKHILKHVQRLHFSMPLDTLENQDKLVDLLIDNSELANPVRQLRLAVTLLRKMIKHQPDKTQKIAQTLRQRFSKTFIQVLNHEFISYSMFSTYYVVDFISAVIKTKPTGPDAEKITKELQRMEKVLTAAGESRASTPLNAEFANVQEMQLALFLEESLKLARLHKWMKLLLTHDQVHKYYKSEAFVRQDEKRKRVLQLCEQLARTKYEFAKLD